MLERLVTLLAVLAIIGVHAPAFAADDLTLPPVQFAQASTGSIVGTPGFPSTRLDNIHAFPSSSGTGISNLDHDRNEEYNTTIQNCQSLPKRQRTTCIDETNKRFGQM